MKRTFHDIFPATERRIRQSTARTVNENHRRQIEANVARYANASPAEIEARIRELEAEWDIERALETGAALNVSFGLAMGALVHRRWFAWSAVVAAFLLQHALQGWCPPLPVMRRLGIRTAAEIDEEKTALRLLRGDFHPAADPFDALAQVRDGHARGDQAPSRA